MNCPDCGAVNPADAKFCGDCGHQITVAKKSPKQAKPEKETGWDDVFKWIGIIVVGLFVLAMLGL